MINNDDGCQDEMMMRIFSALESFSVILIFLRSTAMWFTLMWHLLILLNSFFLMIRLIIRSRLVFCSASSSMAVPASTFFLVFLEFSTGPLPGGDFLSRNQRRERERERRPCAVGGWLGETIQNGIHKDLYFSPSTPGKIWTNTFFLWNIPFF